MPPVTRWFIKSGLLYFIAAMVMGLLLVLPSSFPLPAPVRTMTPTYFHMLMVGWVTQLIFGVAFWMFPTVGHGAQKRGDERPVYASFWLLNVGLALRVLAEPLNSTSPGGVWGWLLVVSALLQWLAALAYVVHIWPRVRDTKKPRRLEK